MPQLAAGLLVACSAFAAIPSSARAQPVYSSGPGPHALGPIENITIHFTALSNKATNDEDRVDSVIWGPHVSVVFVANEPANGPTRCGDPVEYFGQAEGYPDTSQPPRMVIGGQHASYYEKKNYKVGLDIAKIYTGLATCSDVKEDGLVRTIYSLIGPQIADYSDAVKVDRTFVFKPGLGVVKNTGLRAYIPRVQSYFPYVLVPNKAGKLVKYDSASCVSSPCAVTDWNGTWFADWDGGTGGIIVIRDSSSTFPAFVGIQSGGLSNANYTSIVLKQPSAGWSGSVTETEYLCFFAYDSWNPSTTLPFTCGGPPPQ